MQFDPGNPVIKLCAEGMNSEARGEIANAKQLFQQAWDISSNDFEKFTSAHYMARHQKNIADKLKWDEMALSIALKIKDESIRTYYPSLYLNIAKCYEDLTDMENAKKNYQSALSFANLLPDDGYGKMIRSGINKGIERITR